MKIMYPTMTPSTRAATIRPAAGIFFFIASSPGWRCCPAILLRPRAPSAAPAAGEDLAHRCGVGAAESLIDRGIVNRPAGVEERRRGARGARRLADDAHVLLPDLDLHGRRAIAALDHEPPPQAQHTVADRRVRAEQRPHLARIEPHPAPERDRLARGYVKDRDQVV